MFKLLSVALVAIALAGCSTVRAPDVAVLNGVSKHLDKSGKDSSNPGIGARWGAYEVGAYDNSRVYKSNSYYVSRRVWETPHTFADVGVSYYDGQRNYDEKVLPIANVGVKYGPLEVGLNGPVLNARLAIPLD